MSSPTLFLLLLCLGNVSLAQAAADDPLVSAHRLFNQGKFTDAAAAYKAVLEKDASSAPAHAGLVQSYLKAGDVMSADTASREAITLLPQAALVHAVRGDVLFRQGLLADAEKEFRAALKLDEKCARGLLGMGKIYSAISETESARQQFTRAHELDRDDGDALYRWAVLLSYPQSVNELEKHLSQYRSSPVEERREREFIELVRGVGDREIWSGPKEIRHTEIGLELLSPRPRMILGMGLHARFNDTASATLLVDTGSSWMTIPRRLAEKIGARKISEYGIEGVGDSGPAAGYFAWVDRITVGGVEFRDCVVHVAMKDSVAGLDGIVGTNIFSRYSVTLDFPAHKLLLDPLPAQDAATASTKDGMTGPFAFGHVLLLNTSLNHSMSGLFVLDSGANASSVSQLLARRAGKLNDSAKRVGGSSGEVNGVSILPDATLQFSSASQPRHDLLVFEPRSLSDQLGTEVSGFIGFDVLSRMKVRIDYRDGLVEFSGRE